MAAAIWSGSALTAVTELTAAGAADDLDLAIGWCQGQAVLAFRDGDGGGGMDWANWSAGSGWAVGADVVVAGMGDPVALRLRPAADGSRTTAALVDDVGGLWTLSFDGSGWTVLQAGATLAAGVGAIAVW